MIERIDVTRLAATVNALAAIPTRHSCSGETGIGRATAMLETDLGSNAGVVVVRHAFAQPCAGVPRAVANVVGVKRGTRSPQRIIVVGGHYDSIGSRDQAAITIPAPGANDSGSQSAVVLEVAHATASQSFDATIVYVLFAGEEEGLVGSRAFVADLSRLFPGATVEAAVIVDIVGGDVTTNTGSHASEVRLFSPGTPREMGTSSGTTDDTSPSRGLARYVATQASELVPTITVLPRLREDRFGRGSDHMSFIAAGLPAVRLIEAVENLAHQHSPEDVPRHVSAEYMARVAAVVVAAVASLARAPSPPGGIAFHDGALSWTASTHGASSYVFAARPVTELSYGRRVAAASGAQIDTTALGVARGPYFVSVAAVGASGRESMFAYPELRCDGTGHCAVQPGSLDVTVVAR